MSLTESDLREVLADHVHAAPGNAVRLEQVRGRIRRTRRHRQLAASGVLAVAAAAVAVGLTLPGSSTRATVTPAHPSSPASVTPSYGTAVLAEEGPVLLNVTTGATTPVPGRGSALGLSYDGRFLATSPNFGEEQFRIQVTDMHGHVLLSEPTGTQAAAWSPTNDLLAVIGTSSTSTLTLYDVSDGGVHVVARLPIGGADHNPRLAWSRDGQRLAVGAAHELTLVSASGQIVAQRQLGDSSQLPKPATWSGDGSHLVVFLATNAATVQVLDIDETGRQVGSLPTAPSQPQWWHPLTGSHVVGTLGDGLAGHGDKVANCDLVTATCVPLMSETPVSTFAAVPTPTGIAYLQTSEKPHSSAASAPTLMLSGSDGAGAHPAPAAPGEVYQVVASANSHMLLVVGADSSGHPGVYRYAENAATLLTALPAGADPGYYVEVQGIVDWRQPGS